MVRSRVRVVLLPLLVVALLAPGAVAHTDDDHPDPGRSPSFVLFPDPVTVETTMRTYADHPWVTLHELGTSGAGRTLLLAEIADPDSPIPLDERAVTFLFTQQHGNEPAGTPAALRLLADITAGADIAKLLSNQVVLLLPMANPDGAFDNRRTNAQGIDINRDHMHLDTPEARLLHEVLNRFDVHVAMDHHEYGGTGLGNPVPVRVYDHDLTTLYAVHGNVREPTRAISMDLMYEGIWPAAEAAGFTANEYGERTVAGHPLDWVAGGPDPGIMRNHLGLHHIAGILVETRVDGHPNPFHDAERRTAIHTVVMEATLRHVHANAERFIAAKAASMALENERPPTHYREGENVGPLAAAYLYGSERNTTDLFRLHGLAPGIPTDEGVVHNLRGDHVGHMAALTHPASSRALEGGVATAAVDEPADAHTTAHADASAAPLLALLALLGIALVLRRLR